MVSQSLLLQAAAATLALARTPSGFAPESNTDLVVEYGGISADNGVVVSKQSRWSLPRALPWAQTKGAGAGERRRAWRGGGSVCLVSTGGN